MYFFFVFFTNFETQLIFKYNLLVSDFQTTVKITSKRVYNIPINRDSVYQGQYLMVYTTIYNLTEEVSNESLKTKIYLKHISHMKFEVFALS